MTVFGYSSDYELEINSESIKIKSEIQEGIALTTILYMG